MELKHREQPIRPQIQGNPNNREEQHTSERHNNQQEYNYQYYEEYKRLYQTAFYMAMQLKQLAQSKDQIWIKIARLEKKTEDFKDDIRGEPPERKKRFRRTAEQIEKKYICKVERCQRSYGSEGSLQQHIKLKHPELYESKSQHRNSQSHNDSSSLV